MLEIHTKIAIFRPFSWKYIQKYIILHSENRNLKMGFLYAEINNPEKNKS